MFWIHLKIEIFNQAVQLNAVIRERSTKIILLIILRRLRLDGFTAILIWIKLKVLNVFVDVLFFDASLSLESDTLSRQLIVFATKDLFDYLPFDFMLLATSHLWYVFGNNVLAIFPGDE